MSNTQWSKDGLTLLDTLRKDPEDESTWSVLADFLEMQCDPRSELIRINQKLSDKNLNDIQRSELLSRKNCIHTEIQTNNKCHNYYSLLLHRGFYSTLCVYHSVEKADLEVLRKIFEMPDARLLTNLSTRNLTDKSLEALTKINVIQYFTSMDIQTPRLHLNAWTQFAKSDLQNLQNLSIRFLNAANFSAIITSPNLTSLRSLTLWNLNIWKTQSVMKKIGDATFTSSLKELHFNQSHLGPTGVKHLINSLNNFSLKSLRLDAVNYSSTLLERFFQQGHRSLEMLVLRKAGYGLDSNSIVYLHPEKFPNLKHLDLTQTFMQRYIDEISMCDLSMLESLNLSDNRVGDEYSITSLIRLLKSARNLKSLCLSKIGLDTLGLRHLLSNGCFSSLATLDISDNELDDNALLILEACDDLCALSTLNLADNNYTDDQIQRLKLSRLSNCNIIFK